MAINSVTAICSVSYEVRVLKQDILMRYICCVACCSIPQELRDGTLKYSQCQMFDRNYSTLLVQIETEEDLDRLEQQISAINLSLSTTGCLHGWNFDYTQYATTIVTEVGYGLIYTCSTLGKPVEI